MTKADGDPGIGGDASAAGQTADPVARDGKALAQAGGPRVGEPAAGGTGYASGGQPAGDGDPRPEARADTPASNTVAPTARSAMDGDLHETERRSGQTGPRSGGA